MSEDGKFNYIRGPKHDGHYDVFSTDRIATCDASFSRESGIPNVADIAEKKHVEY